MTKDNLVFGMSLGRSGTKWLAELVDTDKNVLSIHENLQSDFALQAQNFGLAHKKIKKQVDKAIKTAKEDLKKSGKDIYFETNCRWRLHSELFKEKVNTIHWTRNPAKVVQSYYDRPNYLSEDHWSIEIKPNDVSLEEWKNRDRFERICWMVKKHQLYLHNCFGDNFAKIEKINESYDYFDKHINKFGINVSKKYWNQLMGMTYHSSSKKDPQEWNDTMRETFNHYCYGLMNKLDYSI